MQEKYLTLFRVCKQILSWNNILVSFLFLSSNRFQDFFAYRARSITHFLTFFKWSCILLLIQCAVEMPKRSDTQQEIQIDGFSSTNKNLRISLGSITNPFRCPNVRKCQKNIREGIFHICWSFITFYLLWLLSIKKEDFIMMQIRKEVQNCILE